MTEFFVPPEPVIEKPDALKSEQVVNIVADYLWGKWQDFLSQRGIWQLNLRIVISKKYSKEAIEWFSKRIAWESLVLQIIKTLDSDDIEYKFTFSLSPTSMFGLPEDNMLVVPSGRQITSDSMEAGSFKVVKKGTLPEYRKEGEKISIKAELQGLKLEFEDNFIYVEIVSKNPEEARERAIGFVNAFAHALTLMIGTHISFEILSGYDQYGRRAPLIHHLSLLKFTSYDLSSLGKQMQESIDVVAKLDPALQKSLEYFNHAAFLNKWIMTLGQSSPDQYRYLLSDIILNLNKSVTTIIGDPTKDEDWKTRYEKYGIAYDFWKSKIDKLRHIRNDWDVAHYHMNEAKVIELEKVIGESFATTKQTLMKYVEYLDSQQTQLGK